MNEVNEKQTENGRCEDPRAGPAGRTFRVARGSEDAEDN